jgi:hypothetical protein
LREEERHYASQCHRHHIHGSGLAANVLGLLAALIILTVLFNSRLPLLGTDRAAFIGLVVVGMAMCALGGIGPAQSTLGWTDPVTLAGMALGSLALVLVAAVLSGRAGFLAPVSVLVGGSSSLESATDRAATLVLAARDSGGPRPHRSRRMRSVSHSDSVS